ncbi:dihydrolipoamide acetyltransferase family protein [Candidatus Sulfurimonas baltica]|uniref:Dihydrolipoamide acetyltransferase component of pyruvate dehydrogenase complex n=1 Tax=Candidatus Sulfurimonas baltica TaxID=2740404 RepID=A0A7S7LV07_9BACT|nr:dihydrolipoamide acetyltransferase family protein [Candidatus Sulfurimonas baltica]QOY51951.1 2-oxo acid dehydrogenase subunit E2 [Candidatus Sulfurimonas baltica]
MSKFLMPSLGADMESAILMEWLVKEGDRVSKGQIIAEVETSKGVIEIEVFEDGIVEKLLVKEESECKVGEPLAIIASDEKKPLHVEEKHESKQPVVQETKEEQIVSEPPKPTALHVEQEARLKISPAARKKAGETGADLSKFDPNDGVVQLSKIEAASTTEQEEPTKIESKSDTHIEKNSGMRQAIATAMSRSNAEIPHYYLSTSINMTPALKYLEELNKKRSIKDRILPVAILIRAVVLSLKEVPELNGFWQNNSHQISKEIHPGIAIALRKGGLITPALLNADIMTIDDTMNSLSDLITRTRGGKLRSTEMTSQTITITNLGDLGVESVFGVIYPPQLAVVGLGAIIDSPWAEGDALCVRKVMRATLAGDHRATDGRTGGVFLDRLNHYLQNPKELL